VLSIGRSLDQLGIAQEQPMKPTAPRGQRTRRGSRRGAQRAGKPLKPLWRYGQSTV
jgi:hypothetical protein